MANDNSDMISIEEVIARHKEGKSKGLYMLISQLKDPVLPGEVLFSYLKELQKHVTYLNKEFEVLVGFLFKMDCSTRETHVINEYLSVIKNIVTVHPVYLNACLMMVIDNFKPKHNTAKDVTQETRQCDEAKFERFHMLLCSLCKLIPMTPLLLVPLLSEGFPFYLADAYILECFVSNLLNIVTYMPSCRVPVLQLILGELTKIDVHAPVFEADNEEFVTVGSSSPFECQASKDNELDPVRFRLDCLMVIVFKFLFNSCHDEGVLNTSRSQALFNDLLCVFDAVLLPTHASHYVQFIMFYICSFHLSMACKFLEHLWQKFEDPNVQRVFRQIAVLYVASYLVRAKHITISTVKFYVDMLVTWIRRYMKLSPQNYMPDVRQHGPYFSACQALFYIFIYRHEELMCSFGLKYCESLYLGSIATSWLNPLRVCIPELAVKFASVVRHNRVAFCDTVIDRNRRYQLPEVTSFRDDIGSLSLDTFFPFQPYTLLRSSRSIADNYRVIESLQADSRHRTKSGDLREEELYMDCDDAANSINICEL